METITTDSPTPRILTATQATAFIADCKARKLFTHRKLVAVPLPVVDQYHVCLFTKYGSKLVATFDAKNGLIHA